MLENRSRDRKSAILDKKRSVANYIKFDDSSPNKVESIRRLTGENDVNIQNFIEKEKEREINEKKILNEMFPKPPKFSGQKKNYTTTNSNKISVCSYASLINNFDNHEIIDSELSLINIENLLSKFEEEEIAEMKVRDFLSFGLEDFEITKKKIQELLDVTQKYFYDEEMVLFLDDKLKQLEENKSKILSLLLNLDKIEDYLVLDETLRVYLKKNTNNK